MSLSQHSTAVTEMKNLGGFERGETPANQLRQRRIQRDNVDISNLMSTLRRTCNPFAIDDSNVLVNIATGKAASKQTMQYLCQTLNRGLSARMTFHDECTKDSTRFLKRIARTSIHNFAVENAKKSTGVKQAGTEGVRDAFGHILSMNEIREAIDLRDILSYPITEIPLSIAHSDGTTTKTDKSVLTKVMESKQNEVIVGAPVSDVLIVDGGLLLHEVLLLHKQSTYGSLAQSIMTTLCRAANAVKAGEVHLVLDKYDKPSIKDVERAIRGNKDDGNEFVITGPDQKQKKSGSDLLKNDKFKDAFARFFQEEIQREHFAPIIDKKIVYISHGGKCIRMVNSTMELCVTQPDEFQAQHSEADTLIAFHAARVQEKIMVRSSDTDVVVILLGVIGRLKLNIKMDYGSKNDRRFIDISGIAGVLESNGNGSTEAIIGLHALSGCDYTSAFYRRGKTKPLELLENNRDEYIPILRSVCNKLDTKGLESFVCHMYGYKGLNEINEARYRSFVKMTGGKKNDVKKINCASLPPASEHCLNI